MSLNTTIGTTSCETPAPTLGTITFEGEPEHAGVFAFAGAALTIHIERDESPPLPTLAELLECAADESRPLAHRLGAAEAVAYELRRKLEHACEEIFPDFYWAHSTDDHPFSVETPERAGVCLPQAKRWDRCDDAVTPERDRALRALGFVTFGGEPLGLVTAAESGGGR